MREIKFRIWDDIKLIYPDNLGYFDKVKIDDGFQSIRIDTAINKKIDVMQYTGLRDKNGKEIYENDIVGGTLQDGTTGASLVFWSYNCYEPFSYLNCRSEELVVIGNIYENPELLENN